MHLARAQFEKLECVAVDTSRVAQMYTHRKKARSARAHARAVRAISQIGLSLIHI